MYNYVVTAQKPTSVNKTLACAFTGPDDSNLIVCKSTRLEIHTLTAEGLQPLLDVSIYGRIATLESFRPADSDTDWLFLSTEKFDFCVLSYNASTGEILTQANGNVQDRVGRPSEHAQIGVVDPKCRVIAMHLYSGLLKTMQVDSKTGEISEAFNIRLEELHVIDIQFLHMCNRPTIAVLFQDLRDGRHVRTYEIDLTSDPRLIQSPVGMANVDTATFLVPVPEPVGGFLIVGELNITYLSPNAEDSAVVLVVPKATIYAACGIVDADGSRFLLGDVKGKIEVLLVERNDKNVVTGLKLEKLGISPIPSTLTYLDDGVVYIGSMYGDSTLVKLSTEKDEEGSYLEVLDTFTNLGPIVDFEVVDVEKQGQGQLVTCSNAFKDGSIRLVSSGIGITEQAVVEMPGVKGLWSLAGADSLCQYLVVSFVGQTRFLSIADEEIEETSIDGFDTTSQTLLCGNVGSFLVQITQKEVRVANKETLEQISSWSPQDSSTINVSDCNEAGQIILSAGSANVVIYLEVDATLGTIAEAGSVTTEHEVACVSLDSFSLDSSQRSSYCAIGLWTDISVRVLRVPSMEEVTMDVLGGEFLPRSVALTSFEGDNYLLAGLGDGHLYTFTFNKDTNALGDKRKLPLGTQPITLSTFTSSGNRSIFAVSDRPTVVYSNNRKLLFSNVNLPEVECVCPFNAPSFPDSLAIYADNTLTIGMVDGIQKLHIRSVPLGEMPRRLAYHASSLTFAVLTMGSEVSPAAERDIFKLHLLDSQTFEKIDSHALELGEQACSLASVTFEGDGTEYLVVGTALTKLGEAEPKAGRILVFEVMEKKLELVHERKQEGAVFCLKGFSGKLLAGVNSMVKVFTWQGTGIDRCFVETSSRSGHIIVLRLATRGDFCIAGDLMRSITLYHFSEATQTLNEVAKDYDPNWMTDLHMMDDDTYLGAENCFNLFTVTKNTDALSDEERGRLETCGQFHLGAFVNCFREGSLVMRPSDGSGMSIPTTIYACIDGSIGIVATLAKGDYEFFTKVQKSINEVISGVGGLSHSKWRSFQSDRRQAGASGFLDGDLIESFLDLAKDKMAEVAGPVGVSVEDLRKKIEDLAQSVH